MTKIKRDILVVDDEPEIRQMLKEFLEEHDFTVTTAKDGIEALECIKKHVPGIVITDLLLPGEHGINLVKTIKEKYFIPTIIVSSIYNIEDVKPVMEEHFVEGFCKKPVNLAELLAKINEISKGRGGK